MSQIINTLDLFNRFEKASFTKEQAQELSSAIADVVDTKNDVNALKRDIKELELRLKHDLTLKMYGLTGLIITAMGVMKFL